MARVEYGAIITSLKGNIAGQTFQNGHVSKVLRNKGYRKGSSTKARQAQVSNLIVASAGWRLMSVAEIEVWNGTADDWPFKDKFGNTYYGTGYQKFVAYTIALKLLGFPSVNAPEAPLNADDPGGFTITCDGSSSLLVDAVNVAGQDQFLQVFASAPMSRGRNGNNRRYRALPIVNMNGGDSWDYWNDYIAIYGIPAIGQIIYFKLQVRTQQFPIIQFPSTAVCFVTP
jgi:hypothetical protein